MPRTPKRKPPRPYGSGSVYQRKRDGRWVASVRRPDGSRRTLYAHDDIEARALLRDLLTGAEPPKRVPAPLTLGDWLATWITTVAPRRCLPQTITRYRLDVNRWTAAAGTLALAALAPSDVSRCLGRWQEAGLSEGSVGNARACLRAALNAAIREGHLSRNVAALTPQRTPTRRSYPTVRPDSVAGLLAALAGTRYALPALVTLATGLRLGELCGLRWPDVDLDAATLTVAQQLQRRDGRYQLVPLKTVRSRRTLALPPVAVAALRQRRVEQTEQRLRARAWRDTLGLVWTLADGAPINGPSWTHGFTTALIAAAVPPLRWHDLRHGAASLLLARGAALRVVMEQLGHSQIGITADLYTHVAPEALRDAAARLEAALKSPETG